MKAPKPQQPAPSGSDTRALDDALARLRVGREAVGKVVVGQAEVIDQVLTALLAGGHVLIESSPGLGKTLLVRTLGTVFGMKFNRIQFTPDLMPADITGTFALTPGEGGQGMVTKFQPGPVFAQMVLADEINRATPKTQSSLLEAMQEGTVTVMGVEYELPKPFFVLATQNPIEMEGTYLLPEAQIDRFFFKVLLPFPSEAVLEAIVAQTTGTTQAVVESLLTPQDVLALQAWTRDVPISSELRTMVARFVRATQPDLPGAPERVRRYVRYGVSPRGAQALVLAAKARGLMEGRYNVAGEDLHAVAIPALRHRVQLNFEGEAAGVSVDDVIRDVLSAVGERSR
jgi:MoxR-like ATPase